MRSSRRSSVARIATLAAVVAWAGGLASPPAAVAATISKANNNDSLSQTTSWWTTDVGPTNPAAIGPTDTLWFGSGMGATRTLALGGDLAAGALRLDNVSGSPNYSVTISPGNTLTLNANNDYGAGTPQGIVLNSGTGGSLTLSADVALGASQIWVTSRPLNVGGGIALGGSTLSFNTAGTSVQTLSGVISGSGSLNKSAGPGTLALANTDNTFTGSVTLVGGNTTVTKLANGGSSSSLGAGSGAIVVNGAALTYVGSEAGGTDRAIDMRAGVAINNNAAANAISFTAATVVQGGTAGARTLTLGGSNAGDNTFGSSLGDSGTGINISRLQKSNAGKWVVTGANTYTGATVINQGTLVVSGSGVLGGAAGGSGDESNIWFTSGNGNAALQFETVGNLGPADQIRFRNTGGTAGQGGALVYIGTTDQTLSKTIQCDTTIGIRLESNSVGGSLTVNGPFSQTTRPLYLGGTGTGNNTLATAFTSTGALTKRGTGTWLLTAANTNTGGVNVEAGTLQVGAGGTSGSMTGNASVSTGATLAFNRSDAVSVAGVISGGGNLRKAGSGTLTLAAANSYSGTTTIAAGTLALGSGGSLASTAIDVAAAGRLDVSALAGGLTLGSGQRLGGRGSLVGNVTFGSGSQLAFDAAGPLVISSGTLAFAAGFGIANLFGVDWDGLGLNTPYTLVSTSQAFSTGEIGNFGFANRVAVGSIGREAYFQNGSLQFVIVPEPGLLAAGVAALGVVGWAARRRR